MIARPKCQSTIKDLIFEVRQIESVAEALQTSEAARMLRNATWLQVDLKGTGAKPARTIGTVVRSLGGVSDAKRVGPRGAQQQLYRWVLPGDR